MQECIDWHDSGIKYFYSFLILNYYKFTKQSYSLLWLALEKLLKIYLILLGKTTWKELKPTYGHKLNEMFGDSKLDEKKFPIISVICKSMNYNEIRYDYELIGNLPQYQIEDIDSEIKNLSEIIVKTINKNFNVNYNNNRKNIILNPKTKRIVNKSIKTIPNLRMDIT